MATIVIGATPVSAALEAISTDYQQALSGAGIQGSYSPIPVGQRKVNIEYAILQCFVEFDTSVIPDTAPIQDVSFSFHLFSGADASDTDFTIYVAPYDFGSSISASDWRTPSQLSSLSPVFSRSTVGLPTEGWVTLNKLSGAESTINKTGYTRYIAYSSRNLNQNVPTGNEQVQGDSPQLTITYPGGGIKRWNGSTWVKHPVKVWNGSSWVSRPVKVWDGSQWVRRA